MLTTLAGCVSSSDGRRDNLQIVDAASIEPRLRPGDRIQLTVFGEDNLSGAYDVSASGTVQVPLVGAVPAVGRTVPELEAAVTTALRRTYLRSPKVTVALLNQRPFYVLGEVSKPGEYPYREGLNLWRALAVAGGQTYRASTSAVLIQHAGQSELAEVDTSRDIAIAPGDLIRVPERWF